MATIVTGLIPILRTAVDATEKCRSLRFGFLCVRLVILFLPFSKLEADFTCDGTGDSICSRACFNKPVTVIYVLVILSVLELEVQVVSTDLHRDRGAGGFYLLSISLRILIEAWFVYVLLPWNLAALNNAPYKCSIYVCSELHA